MNTKLDARIRALVVEVVETSPVPPLFEELHERALANATQTRAMPVRARSRRRLASAAVAAISALALGSGSVIWLGGGSPGSRIVTLGAASTRVGTHGVSVAIPRDWNAARAGTTSLVDPAEAFSVGTFPLRAAVASCPRNALADLRTRDAFITAWVWSAPPPTGLPARPTRFGPPLHWETNHLCSRLVVHASLRSLDFQASGRWISVIVVLGTRASAAATAQAYRVLDSLVVHPQS